ncbi:MAG: hypothetical protein HQ523_16340 [Lentisphaerae bacterium]|nr:hypothetical protein [Lentisphaerota bacterium]
MKRLSSLLIATVALALLSGCAAFRSSIKDVDPADSSTLTANYDQRDLLSWTDEMSNLILKQFPPEGEKPILSVFGIENRTKQHLDTQSLADTISGKLLDSGTVQLTNTSRRDELLREQGFQLQNATPESRVAVGRQLGAKYMLTGSLTEINSSSVRQVRVSKKEDIFFMLTCEITDLETGLIVLRKQVQRMRRARKPIIGW